ncbi:VTT domain-containing protein [Sinimarinibacterium sp. NLF-5-8]|uniref:VTT domain-containing protein n=1 Tax=Sinimarinibacterium sp. NLF-5-8 TaxID=2698684 RepID=UPI00137BE4A9|nr:VTT domain-containing protein [Sinimarinibacterium sp. NLF-5-8]QHS08807.1 hypothetical protein GT972_00740 [Sinimarinibacterium sp. NLF-5-8]
MTDAIQHFLDWVNAHPGLSLIVLFLASMFDAIFLLGALVPASIVLFAIGALITLDGVGLWQAIGIAAAGALAGDGFSFWLGRHYGESLFANKYLARYPTAIENSRKFFERYGVQGIMLARFLGPMRSLTPALAGASRQNVIVFLLADSIAAVAWAFAYIMPGVVFGASLGLAAEVASRLAMLLLAVVAIVWLSVWLTLRIARRLQRSAEPWIVRVLQWSRRYRRLGRFGTMLTDSGQPETPALAVFALILLAISAIWLYLVAGPGLHPYPSALDAGIFQALRDWDTPWGQFAAQAWLLLGSWTVYAPVAATTFAMLILLRKRRASAHWLAALGFGGLLSLGLHTIPTLPAPYQYFDLPQPPGHNTSDLILASVIYAFLPVLLAPACGTLVRALLYGTSAVVLSLLALAHLYVGTQWFSLALFTLAVASLWASLLGIGYRRHRPEALPILPILLPTAAVAVLTVSLSWHPQPLGEPTPARATMSADAWRSGAWRTLPIQRRDSAGRPKQPLQLQWAGDLAQIRNALQAAGWQPPIELSSQTALHWLSNDLSTADLPILPQVHAGQHPALSLRLSVDQRHQYLIRLWGSGYHLQTGTPVWVGSISAQRARSFYRILNYPVTDTLRPPLKPLLDTLSNVHYQRHGDAWLLWFDPESQEALEPHV